MASKEDADRVEGAVDEFKREVLNSCAVAWCTGVFRGANLVAELKQAEAWNPEITIATWSAWLSVVGLPMHMWSKETFNRIAQLWGRLIRVEDVTLEPQCFERARFLIETDCLERVDETVELVPGDWSGKIRVQEVDVVHAHDVLCQCEGSGSMVSSEDEKSDGATPRVLRENPVFIPSGQDCAVSMVAWYECIGMLDRGMGSGSERFDAMWCDSALA
ncbi:hypothetical protein V6N13_001640 [Hibiscus sabdariffa]